MHPCGRVAFLLAVICTIIINVHAAISFGPNGTSLITFDTQPSATEWSTRSIPGGSRSIPFFMPLEWAVQTNTAAMINTQLPVAHFFPPQEGDLAQWNDNTTFDTNFFFGQSIWFLQTRPTENAVTLLMATLQNDSGSEIRYLDISYDQGTLNYFNEELIGYEVYYSLTGMEGNWRRIPELSGWSFGFLAALVDLRSSPWHLGESLYILWADDNYPEADPSYTIDNFSVGIGDRSPSILWQPTNTTVLQCRALTLPVDIAGGRPMTLQWHKNSTPIDPNVNQSAATRTLFLGNAQPSDTGTYFLWASNAFGWIQSSNITLIVEPDTAPPTIVKAQWDEFDVDKLIVTFSEPIESLAREPYGWAVESRTGGDPFGILSGVFTRAANDQTVLIIDSAFSRRDPGGSYSLVSLLDLADQCLGNLMPAGTRADITCPERFSVSITHSTNGMISIWRTCGTLQETSWLSGGWTNAPDQANPLTLPASQAAQFYRARE
jgi:Ig-like domain-containing protein